jgi:hypothetical protein
MTCAQITGRELENELASLYQTEKMLENDVRPLEGKIIEQEKAEIEAKKSVLEGLESWKSNLEKKSGELQEKSAGSQTEKEQNASGETAEHVQQDDTVRNGTELTVVEYQRE